MQDELLFDSNFKTSERKLTRGDKLFRMKVPL